MSDQATGFTGDIPGHYDAGLGPVIFADFAADMARRAVAARPARVLETAAGTGIVTRRLRDLLEPDAALTATDLNPPMLEVARARFGPGERVVLQPADAADLPFADAAFDLVVCQFGVMFFPDKDRAYREVHRVLAPGGRYLFSVWDSHRRNAFGRLAHEVVGGFFPTDPPQFYQAPFGYHDLDAIRAALAAAGFIDVAVEVMERDKAVADLDAFSRALVFGNPLIDQVRSRGGVDPERIVAALRAALLREFGPEPVRLALRALLIEATRP